VICARYRLLPVGLLFLVFSAGSIAVPAAHAAEVQDELWLELQGYHAAQGKIGQQSPEAKRRFWRHWLERISKSIAQNPKSPNRESALLDALTLSNGLNDWVYSRLLIEDLLDATRGDPRSQMRWLTELGEIMKLRAIQTRDASDREAAVEAFAAANDEYAKMPPQMRAEARLREQVVLNWAWSGEVQVTQWTDAAAQAGAAASFRQAREAFEALQRDVGPPAHRLLGTGYDEHWLLSSEAMALVRAGNYEAALVALKQLSGVEGRWPPGFYIVEATMYQPQDRQALNAFLKEWLATAPKDPWHCAVQYRLAASYLREDNQAEARPLFEDLVDNNLEAFRQIEEEAMRDGSGGYYALSLHDLRQIYLREKQTEKAKQIAAKLAKLYPAFWESHNQRSK